MYRWFSVSTVIIMTVFFKHMAIRFMDEGYSNINLHLNIFG